MEIPDDMDPGLQAALYRLRQHTIPDDEADRIAEALRRKELNG